MPKPCKKCLLNKAKIRLTYHTNTGLEYLSKFIMPYQTLMRSWVILGKLYVDLSNFGVLFLGGWGEHPMTNDSEENKTSIKVGHLFIGFSAASSFEMIFRNYSRSHHMIQNLPNLSLIKLRYHSKHLEWCHMQRPMWQICGSEAQKSFHVKSFSNAEIQKIGSKIMSFKFESSSFELFGQKTYQSYISLGPLTHQLMMTMCLEACRCHKATTKRSLFARVACELLSLMVSLVFFFWLKMGTLR